MFRWPVEHVLQGLHSRWPSSSRSSQHPSAPPALPAVPGPSTTATTVIPISAARITITIISELVSAVYTPSVGFGITNG